MCIDSVNENEIYISSNIQNSSLNHLSSDDFMSKLTSSEIKILKQLPKNKTSQDIGDNLFISKRTVEKHRSNIIQKWKITSAICYYK
ncbi:MAG: LuxR C-terminal-related transcriptional regulator [Flavobacteriales bacterium]|nr:LuxR C-terminal-related transcriptional regulator [Flavobacteriales bacterium]